MEKPKVLIYAPREEPEEIRRQITDAGYDLAIGDRAWTLPRGDHTGELMAAARGAVALMGTSIRHTPITREVMESCPDLRIVAKYTVGVDDVDTDAATELGVLVCHAPTESNFFAVAETTVTVMLTLLKKVFERDADVRAGKWREPHHGATFVGSRMSDGYPGITIGLVGLGRIGKRVAQLLAPWRVRIIAYDPYIDPVQFLLSGVKSVDYETLLRESDVVSFHVVLTRETRYMLSDAQIAQMKPGAIVINTARGKVIDEAAVARAISEGRLAGAGIDAFEEEPLPAESPLRALGHKVILSPHSAAFSYGGELRPGIVWATRSVLSALSGTVPDNVYNRDVISRWKQRFGGRSVASTSASA
jgi:phosphoglycerate dehydrogenase-like enzyme